MIHETTFVVVDTETTGAIASQDRIVEIGAVKVKNGKIVDTYSTLLNPERFIPHNVIQIHGITDDMVKDAPRFIDVADEFVNFLGHDSVFTAHNVDFDKDFVNCEFKRINYDPMHHQTLCTLKLARKVFPDIRRYNLGSLSSSLGINLDNAHRALDDSIATAHVLIKMFNQLESNGKIKLEDINLKSIQPLQAQTMSLF